MPKKSTRYRVTAGQIVAKVRGAQGGEAYFKQGRLLPAITEDKEAKRLLKLGLVEAVEVETGEPDFDKDTPTDEWTVEQLRAFAKEKNISLAGTSSKESILEHLAAALAAAGGAAS